MSKENKLIPELRFPEFEKDGEWEIMELQLLADRVTDKNKNGKIDKVFTNSAAHGIVDQREYFEKDIANKSNLENYYIVENGDYVYNPRISTEAPVGPTSRNNTGRTGVMSPLYTVFRFREKKNQFYEYYFISQHWYDSIRKASNTGARFDRMSITDSVFMSIPVLYPNPQEQQKIASCLSSLDELIAAHKDKLAALKDHKKGLLQNLFPQEGETVPKVRFPEFEDDGEWVEKKLGEVCNMQAGKFVRASDIKEKLEDGLSPCFGGNGLRGYTESFTHIGKYSLIGRQGALCGNVNLVDGQFHATEHAVVVTPEDYVDTDLLYYVLVLLNLNQYATGQAQPGLSVTNLEEVELKLPENIQEQQKIASCLSAVDELITARQEKIEELQQHKKGLMQGLFPKMV